MPGFKNLVYLFASILFGSILFSYHQVNAQCDTMDWRALKALYESTNGDDWIIRAGWDIVIDNYDDPPSNCDLSLLHGVELDVNDRVTELIITSNLLNGNIPGELGNLKNLRILDLSENQLTGSIPPEIGDLTNLIEIDLRNTSLSGNLPPELGQLGNLLELDLRNNNFSGNIPLELCKLINIEKLYLTLNNLSGSIPTELGSLPNLRRLWLDNNELTGSIPPELSSLSNLYELNLHVNNLTGELPIELANMNSLTLLNVHSNNLDGCYPEAYSVFCDQFTDPAFLWNFSISKGNCFDATWVDFCQQGIEACNLVESTQCHGDWFALKALYESTNGDNWSIRVGWDSIIDNHSKPPLNYDLSTLQGVKLDEYERVVELDLSNNGLTGIIASELCNLTNLKILKLHFNQIRGRIPLWLGLLTKLEDLFLDNNNLVGNIPTELGRLYSLKVLNLQDNNLTGVIPDELGSLSKLETLNLHNNHFSGNLPTVLINLLSLNYLAVNNNNLSGCYPSELKSFCWQLDILGNASISNDNDFDTTWEDFCNNDAGICISEQDSINNNDLEALKALYNSTNGNDWKNRTGWDSIINNQSNQPTDFNLDNLYGVKLNDDERVSEINLSNNNLNGIIPEEIGMLSDLELLILNNNRLSDSIPTKIKDLNKLSHLLLFNNQLTGNIPAKISQMQSLTRLGLSSNRLTGSIPPEFSNSNIQYFHLDNNLLSGAIPRFEQRSPPGVALFDVEENYLNCIDLQLNYVNNQFVFQEFDYETQYFTPLNYDSIKANVFDTLSTQRNLTITVEISFEPSPDVTYQWKRNGNVVEDTNDLIFSIDTVHPKNVGKYTLHIIDDNCIPNGKNLDLVSDPIYVILKGYDLFGKPVEYDQIMVEFSDKEETKFYEEEILLENGFVQKACNCNRELYLWQFLTTEAAARALLEIDKKQKKLKSDNEPTGGFNNIIAIGDSTNASIAYNIVSDQFGLDYPDSVKVFILDSGLDTTNYNAKPYLYQNTPVDSCYKVKKSGGYNYTEPDTLITNNYKDDLWHGTFGYRSIADGLNENGKIKIVPLKIFNNEGKGNLFNLACAMYQAIDHNAHVINVSAGYKGQPSTVLERAILLAREKGIFITAAAGNDTLNIDSIPQYPAYYSGQYYAFEKIDQFGNIVLDSIKYDNVISVASINASNNLSQFSNFGKESVTLGCYGEKRL